MSHNYFSIRLVHIMSHRGHRGQVELYIPVYIYIYISSLFHTHIHEYIIKCNSMKQKVTYIQIMIIMYINHSVYYILGALYGDIPPLI